MEGINPNSNWKVNRYERLSACDNRPGLKKFYVTVLDASGMPLRGIKVGFDTVPSKGIVYDHPNYWGKTDENGYAEWEHLGIPTRYNLYVNDELVIGDIRTDLGNENCNAGVLGNWRPVNRPGIYSYRIEIQGKGESVLFQPPVVSNLRIEVQVPPDQHQGYARAIVTCDTDVVTVCRAYYGLCFEGVAPGEELQEICDPYSVGGFRSGKTEAGLYHRMELEAGLFFDVEASKKFCLQVVAALPEYQYWDKGKGYSEKIWFTVP